MRVSEKGRVRRGGNYPLYNLYGNKCIYLFIYLNVHNKMLPINL